MELMITGRHLEVPDPVKDYLQRKFGKLNRHLAELTEAQVEITEEDARAAKDRFVVQVTLYSDGTILRGEERGSDLFTAIDAVANVLDRQIERYKGRYYYRGRRQAAATAGPSAEEMAEEVEEESELAGRVVKTKRFDLKPMDEEEAIEQMELLGHGFFVFYNSNTEQINVLYRREDGDYGLIVPEVP